MVIGITGTSRTPEVQQPEREVMMTPFRLFEDVFNDWATRNAFTRRHEAWKPAVDILEKNGNFIIRMELPGITEKEFDIKIEGKSLTIKAEKKMEPEDSGYTYHQVEGFYGSYARSFDLPDSVDATKISAAYVNGVLLLTIPQKPEVKPRSIKVDVKD
jgi:HSP20 family protein